jgi:vesicle coat complex subunit
MRDILRKHRRFEGALPVLCQNIDEIDEPESQAAMVWILGEYADRIDNVQDILKGYVDSFLEEPSQVQLQILTACVKLYIKKPALSGGQNLIHSVLQTATTKCDTADIRDRAYIYWRLLSSDTSVAKDVVLSEKPPIDSTIDELPSSVLSELLGELSTLASVYHKPAASFMGTGRFGSDAVQLRALEEQRQLAKEDAVAAPGGANAETLLDLDDGDANSEYLSQNSPASASLGDLSDIFAAVPPPAPSSNGSIMSPNENIMSLFGATSSRAASTGTMAEPVPARGGNDILSGFDGLSLGGNSGFVEPSATAPAPVQNGGSKPEDDLIGLF